MIRSLRLLLPLLAALALTMPPAAAQDTGTDAPQISDQSLGADDAPVEFVEYASFTCPHCATFHAEILPRLKADYIDTGKVRFTHREVFFGIPVPGSERRLYPGLWAALVARCSAEDRYFGIADMIYAQQSSWLSGNQPGQWLENLRRIGRAGGLTDDQLDQCLNDGDKAQALYAWYAANAERHGVASTPSFVIDGELHRNMPYEDLRALIDDRLAADG